MFDELSKRKMELEISALATPEVTEAQEPVDEVAKKA